MQLTAKGDAANLATSDGVVKQLLVAMKWTTAADFDVGAYWEAKDGKKGLVYFNEKGSLNAFPFIRAEKDAGVGDRGGDNREQMTIAKIPAEMAKVHLIAWDYGSVRRGQAARFTGSDLKLEIVEENGEKHEVTLATGEAGNVLHFATIDNTGAIGAKLVNKSKPSVLKGWPGKLEDLNGCIDA